jgi:hypothetical protein
MRARVPADFSMSFSGPEGPYRVHFRPTDDWDGVIDVVIGGVKMVWHVDDCDQEKNGGIVLGGMSSGSEPLWNDVFWFELRLNDAPPVIRYWGNEFIWREDRAV